MTYERIPAELRALKQWVLWDKDKVPHQVNGKKADVTDSSTWNTFDACCCVDGFNGIGFVFSSDDVYTGIDLDAGGDAAAQLAIFNVMDSYSEISPSGKGLHIIVKGTVPSGARKEKIEVYSSGRYFTMTGNVYPFNSEKSIRECQSELIQLWEQLQPRKAMQDVDLQVYNSPQTESDEKIIERCRKADNGEWFSRLYAGDFSPDNNGRLNIQIEKHRVDGIRDESRDDLALFNFIVFHTHNLDQIERIFHSSALGKRKKAYHRGYLDRTIKRAFDQTPPPVDISGFKEALDATLNKVNGHKFDVVPTTNSTIDIPPGLVGEIARFIYAAAPRPIWEIALAGAIGLMAGICGRAYNIKGNGLNQYILLLAPTGMGKDGITAISPLMSAVNKVVFGAEDFLGPSAVTSGAAIINHLSTHPTKSFVAFFDEFAHKLQTMCHPKANTADISFKAKLLELYGNSGKGKKIRPSLYADVTKSSGTIDCPAVSVIAYSTPEKLYSLLNEDMITDGLLSRFTLIEYKGNRPETNYDHFNAVPPSELVSRLADLCEYCFKLMLNKPEQKWQDVILDEKAEAISRNFGKYCDDKYNEGDKDLIRGLWSRGYSSALKLAALIAVGCNPYMPTITAECFTYAATLIENTITALWSKFDKGEVGDNKDQKQIDEIMKIIPLHIKDWEYAMKYGTKKQLFDAKIIPYRFISHRLTDTASFRNDPKGATEAIKKTVQVLIDRGALQELNKQELVPFKTRGRCFIISDADAFEF